MSEDKRDVSISKSLAYLLRHGAVKEKLPIDNNGYIPVANLLRHNRLKSLQCTQQDVDRVVANNAKKRFHLKVENGQTLICATQGHSIATVAPADEVLQLITESDQLPQKLVHGTNLKNCKLILETGLIKKMRRNHVHLAPGVTGVDRAVISGMRTSSNVHIFLNLEKTLETTKIYRSLNDVYLTPEDIPVELFEKVILRANSRNKTDLDAVVSLLRLKKIPYSLE